MSYVVRIAVNTEGNPVVQVRPSPPEFLPHPSMPYPIALPAKDFPSPSSPATQDYATQLLRTAGLLAPSSSLVFTPSGHSLINGQRYAVVSAPLPPLTPPAPPRSEAL